MALKSVEYSQNRYDISYELENIQGKRTIVFLHGWGSNKEIMKMAFGNLFEGYKKIYIDMPGFGKSSNSEVLNTFDYAKIIDLLLIDLKIEKQVVVGHSFGGKVAVLLNPDILVLLSSSGILVKKPLKVKLKIALSKVLKPFLGDRIRRAFISEDAKDISLNMYETFKNVVDEDFSSYFANFKNRALIFWGKDDLATPLECGERISEIIENSSFYHLKGDHYFFLEEAKTVEETIIGEIEKR